VYCRLRDGSQIV